VTLSIRKFLLINLLLAITITTTLTAIGNYYLDQRDIQKHLDSLMALFAMSYQTLLTDELEDHDLKKIQSAFNDIPNIISRFHGKIELTEEEERYATKFNLQVWDSKNVKLIASPNAPQQSLLGEKDGFSDKFADDHLWRVFTYHNPVKGIATVVAERYDSRNELAHSIARDDIYIMLITFPLSGILIWLIIGSGLSSLTRVAREVANRAPSYLEPVDLSDVPVEIKPVIVELNKLFERLYQALEREKRFSADAAHELRTPLAALKTQAQLALVSDDEGERTSALNNVVASVDRSSHIVQQLLTLSRLVPEAAHIDECIDVNLTKLSAEIIAQLAPSACLKNIDIELVAPDNDVILNGNITALSILIRNLVDNAIRYTPKNGLVKVYTEVIDDQVLLRVADSGPGIPAELRERVFERFFRVLGTKTPGSGLGLAIVQQIVKLHGATIALLVPVWGYGLEVRVTFPQIHDHHDR
jgi:two-component system sensor histidine kinase QseC